MLIVSLHRQSINGKEDNELIFSSFTSQRWNKFLAKQGNMVVLFPACGTKSDFYTILYYTTHTHTHTHIIHYTYTFTRYTHTYMHILHTDTYNLMHTRYTHICKHVRLHTYIHVPTFVSYDYSFSRRYAVEYLLCSC